MDMIVNLKTKLSFKITTIFYASLAYQAAWVGGLFHPMVGMIHSITFTKKENESAVSDAVGSHLGVGFLEFETFIYIAVFVLQCLSVLFLVIGYDRKQPKKLLASLIWNVSFFLLQIPVYTIFLVIFLNNLPKPSVDKRYKHVENFDPELADRIAGQALTLFNVYAAFTILFEIITGLLSSWALLKLYKSVRLESVNVTDKGIDNPNSEPDPPQTGNYNRFG